MSTVSNFVESVIAIIKGDDARAIGLKIQRRAIAILTAQIAIKVCKTLALEGVEDTAEGNLNKARLNSGTLIINDDQYIQNLLDAKFKYDQAAAELVAHKQDIEFLKKELENAKK
jgi:intracellular sulfur oxidation DsrE/DsrF family protein